MTAAHDPIILMYHSVSDGDSPLKVSPGLFLAQMEWLAKNATVVSLGDVVEVLGHGGSFREHSVALTFDDGFQNFYTNAAPALQRLGFPATVFLPTSYCGKTNAWPGQPAWADAQPLMDWEQVRELAKQGINFGGHSQTHPDLTQLPETDVEREIIESKREIEGRAACSADFFCYPYGRWNPNVRAVVRQHFRGACATAAGLVQLSADPFALPRVDAHYVRSFAIFCNLFTRRFRAYLAARRLVRRMRGQPEGYYSSL